MCTSEGDFRGLSAVYCAAQRGKGGADRHQRGKSRRRRLIHQNGTWRSDRNRFIAASSCAPPFMQRGPLMYLQPASPCLQGEGDRVSGGRGW